METLFDSLLNTIKQLDTPLEWGETTVAFIIMLIGFSLGSFIATKIFKVLSGIAFLGILYYVIYQIAQGVWTEWKEIAYATLGVGFILSFLVVHFSVTAEFEGRISKLENET